MTATEVPTMGVHSPGIRRSPHPARNADDIVSVMGGVAPQPGARVYEKRGACNQAHEKQTWPGQPPANVEYKRRNAHPFVRTRVSHC